MRLSQEDFAKQLGISRNYVSMIELGREPSEALIKLFDRLEKEHLPQETGARSKLKKLREAKGLTALQLAKQVGYSVSVYQDIEEGRSQMSRKMAERVAKALECDLEELIDGSDHPPANGTHFGTFGETPAIVTPPGMKAKFVPLLSMAQCGSMMAYDDTAYAHDGFVAFNCDDPKAFAVTLAGDSMSPVFSAGDVAVIHPSKTPRNGGVVIARLNEGDVMMKLYQSTGERITLSSYNPAFPPMTFNRRDFVWIYSVASVTKVL